MSEYECNPIRCPYSDTKIWCDRVGKEDFEKGTPMTCDACYVIVSVGWEV